MHYVAVMYYKQSPLKAKNYQRFASQLQSEKNTLKLLLKNSKTFIRILNSILSSFIAFEYYVTYILISQCIYTA